MGDSGKPKKIAKLEAKASKIQVKRAKVASKLDHVSQERDERAAVLEQLYAPQSEIATGVENMSIDEDAAAEKPAQEVEQPTAEPMVAFQYQNEFEQVMRM